MDIFYYDTAADIVSEVHLGEGEHVDKTIQHLAHAYPMCIYFFATLVVEDPTEVKNEDTPVSPGGTEHDVRTDGSVAVDSEPEENHV